MCQSGGDSSINRSKKCRSFRRNWWQWEDFGLFWNSKVDIHPYHSSCLLCQCSGALTDTSRILVPRDGKETWSSCLYSKHHKFQLWNVSQKIHWQHSLADPMMRLFSYRPRFYLPGRSFWYNWLFSFTSPEGNRKSVSTEDLIGQTRHLVNLFF